MTRVRTAPSATTRTTALRTLRGPDTPAVKPTIPRDRIEPTRSRREDRLRDAGVQPGDHPGLVQADDVRQGFAERRDEIRTVTALGDSRRDRPHLGVEFQAALDARADLVDVVRGDPEGQVLAQQRLHLLGFGLREVVGPEKGRPDGIRLLDDEAAAGVEPVRGHAHRDREQERHEPEERADQDARRALLFARRSRLPPAPRPEARARSTPATRWRRSG